MAKTKDLIQNARKLAKPFRITSGKNFKLKKFDPGETLGFSGEDKPRAKEALAADPGSRDLTFLLSSAYEMEIDLLRQATEI